MYVDGFLVAVPKKNLDAYKKFSRKAGKIWMEHGALSYIENWGDDVPKGKLTSFPMAVKLERNEVVVFSWITYKNKTARDRINKKVMSDPRLQMAPDTMPFDGARLIYGGFKSIVQF